jgi:minor extracellular serine protease Vpr
LKKFNKYLLLVSAATTSSCTKLAPPPGLVSDPSAFSTRAAPPDGIIKIIQFKTPSIIDSSKLVGNELVINERAKAKLLEEQSRVELELKKQFPTSKILFRYRMNFNGFAVAISKMDVESLKKMNDVVAIHSSAMISKPKALEIKQAELWLQNAVVEASSTGWIGATKLNKSGITGKGIRVGVIDTGLDYTHKMFGGKGDPEDFAKNDPQIIEPGSFPTEKVLGGIDLSGDQWLKKGDLELPQPDLDPLDAGDHGTHVAGSIAGVGDDVNTYSGVAPEASLYAIKVFPKDGGTTDEIVMAALEYASDPNGDLNPSDRLDVVNLSLGSEFGLPVERAYPSALKVLEKAGVAVIMAAGNSGNTPYIVGAPSSLYEGQLSVAASIDNAQVNWLFPSGSAVLVGGKEASFEVRWAPTCDVPEAFLGKGGNLVHIGLADKDLTSEEASRLSGNIALIDRGAVSFQEKVNRAIKANAKGVVIINKDDSEPMSPSVSDLPKEFPIVMIALKDGLAIKEALKTQSVDFKFNNGKATQRAELIDQIAGFSSRGPRLGDGLIKPQISAPGQNILSANAGKGTAGIRMSGTSMASPHMAGAMALLKQVLPNATIAELNTRLMNNAEIMIQKNANGKNVFIDIARQGAGRVKIPDAIASTTLVTPNALSLGFVDKNDSKALTRKLVVENKSSSDQTYNVALATEDKVKASIPSTVFVKAHAKTEIPLKFEYLGEGPEEIDGFIILTDREGTTKVASVPFLGNLRDDIELSARYNAFKKETKIGNKSSRDIELLTGFKLLGQNHSSPKALDSGLENPCDLNAAASRLREIEGKKVLEIMISVKKRHDANVVCEPSVQLDLDANGVTDIEAVLTTSLANYAPVPALEHVPGTVLLDFAKAKEIALFNQQEAKKEAPKLKDPVDAIIDFVPSPLYAVSSLQLITIPVEALGPNSGKTARVKVAMQAFGDEFLKDAWSDIDLEQASTESSLQLLKAGTQINLKKSKASDIVFAPGAKIERGLVPGRFAEIILLN